MSDYINNVEKCSNIWKSIVLFKMKLDTFSYISVISSFEAKSANPL